MTSENWNTLTPQEQFNLALDGRTAEKSAREYGRRSMPTTAHLQCAAEHVALETGQRLVMVKVSLAWGSSSGEAADHAWYWEAEVQAHGGRSPRSTIPLTITGYGDDRTLQGLLQAAEHVIESVGKQREMGHIQ